MCWETVENSSFNHQQKWICPHKSWQQLKHIWRVLFILHAIWDISDKELYSLVQLVNRQTPSPPLHLFFTLIPYTSLSLSPSIYMFLSISSTQSPFFSSSHYHPLLLSLTNAARRAGLPVESIFHLDAGDSALSLQFISRITREGHRVAGLPPFTVTTAIHGNTWISAGCCKWTWRATHTHVTHT